jgi:hypothetical protein
MDVVDERFNGGQSSTFGCIVERLRSYDTVFLLTVDDKSSLAVRGGEFALVLKRL